MSSIPIAQNAFLAELLSEHTILGPKVLHHVDTSLRPNPPNPEMVPQNQQREVVSPHQTSMNKSAHTRS
jgi:hypothetical protein